MSIPPPKKKTQMQKNGQVPTFLCRLKYYVAYLTSEHKKLREQKSNKMHLYINQFRQSMPGNNLRTRR